MRTLVKRQSMYGKRRKNQRHAGGAKLKHDYKN